MLCERCNNQEATVRLAEVSDGKKQEHHLCEVCASSHADMAPTIGALPSGSVPVQEILENLIVRKCPECRISFREFRHQGRLGCATCYEAFAEELEPLLERIHGGLEHRGKTPTTSQAELTLLRERRALEAQLNAAVADEAFEHAAELRDQIQSLDRQPHGD